MNPSIKVIPFPEILNSYIIISASKPSSCDGLEYTMSFIYDNQQGFCVEWEPKYGPITVIQKCESDHPNATPFWLWPYCKGFGNWSQLAVNKERLPEYFKEGNYKMIFTILKKWADRN
jgi:hypothetical protein